MGVQARAASAAGHELLVHLPMEPFNKAADAGPNALHSGMTSQQLKEHLNWALAQFEGEPSLGPLRKSPTLSCSNAT